MITSIFPLKKFKGTSNFHNETHFNDPKKKDGNDVRIYDLIKKRPIRSEDDRFLRLKLQPTMLSTRLYRKKEENRIKFSRKDNKIATYLKKSVVSFSKSERDYNKLKYYKQLKFLSIDEFNFFSDEKKIWSARKVVSNLKYLGLFSTELKVYYSKHNKKLKCDIQDSSPLRQHRPFYNGGFYIPRMQFLEVNNQERYNKVDEIFPYKGLELFRDQFRLKKIEFNNLQLEDKTVIKLFKRYQVDLTVDHFSDKYYKFFEIIKENLNHFNYMIHVNKSKVTIKTKLNFSEIAEKFSSELNNQASQFNNLLFAQEIQGNKKIIHVMFNSIFIRNLLHRYLRDCDWKLYFSPTSTLTNQDIIQELPDNKNLSGYDQIFYSYRIHQPGFSTRQVLLSLIELRNTYVSNPRTLCLQEIKLNSENDAERLINLITGCRNLSSITLDLIIGKNLEVRPFAERLLRIMREIKKFELKINKVLFVSCEKNKDFTNNVNLEVSSGAIWTSIVSSLIWEVIPPTKLNFTVGNCQYLVFQNLCSRIKREKTLKNLSLKISNCQTIRENRLKILTDSLVDEDSEVSCFNMILSNGLNVNLNKFMLEFDKKIKKKKGLKIQQIQFVGFCNLDQVVKNIPYVYS